MTSYRVFTRTWWKENPAWPRGLEPCPGEKTYVKDFLFESDARTFCKNWNNTHEPGRLSEKAEYEEE